MVLKVLFPTKRNQGSLEKVDPSLGKEMYKLSPGRFCHSRKQGRLQKLSASSGSYWLKDQETGANRTAVLKQTKIKKVYTHVLITCICSEKVPSLLHRF